MKKIMIILVAFMLVPSSAFAVDVTVGGELKSGTGDKDPSVVLSVLSNNVVATVIASADRFSAITKHINGSKNFATSSESTKIYSKSIATENEGSATFEIDLATSDTTEFAAWSPL